MKILSSIYFVFVLFAVSCQTNPSNHAEGETPITALLSPEAFQVKIEAVEHEALLLDVRTDAEIETYGQIPGSISIDYFLEDFDVQISQLDSTKPILVYCWSGGRSGEAVDILLENGFREIYDLDGGYSAWLDWVKE